MNNKKARVIAYYLPQYHPVPANDKYWGKGFTEWTNVAKARPLFRNHYQPRIPADLGFYDLRLEEVRIQQAELAKQAGIEGFCYWHYWFGSGKEVLEMPFNKVVESGEPDFPFCLGWANHDWTTKSWDKGHALAKQTMIFKQEYPGVEDHIAHFYRYLNAFKDHRYIKVDGRLLFVIFSPRTFENIQAFFELWQKLARENDLPGFYFVGITASVVDLSVEKANHLDATVDDNIQELIDMGFDAVTPTNQKYAEVQTGGKVKKALFGMMRKVAPEMIVEKYDYRKIYKHFYSPSDKREDVFPQLLAGWDRSPRSGRKAIVYYNSTPETFGEAAAKAVETVSKKEVEHRIIFLNSWNEWGEGAYMEPDLRYGRGFIDKLKDVIYS